MFNITVVGDRELVARFGAMPGRIREALVRKTYALAFALERKVKQKLSGPVLNVRTGALRRSIQNKVETKPAGVIGKVYSAGDVKYAGIHEFGGKTRAHVIMAKKAAALAFMGSGGKMVFRRMVNHPGSVMPERSFMRTSLAEMRGEIESGYREAVIQAAARK